MWRLAAFRPLWHLLEVQDFWAYVIEQRPSPPEGYREPTRPEAGDLPAGLRDACARLTEQLRHASPDEVAWSWADDHTVGFTLGRQAHEAFVHLVDGILAVDEDLPSIPPPLAADGVEEILPVMLTGVPERASFERLAGTVELVARDTGDRWRIGPGRMTGVSPRSGNSTSGCGVEPRSTLSKSEEM